MENFLSDGPCHGAAMGVERERKWGQQRRLEFIDFRLKWDGRLNRGDLRSYFSISIPQASLDIARYAELAPGNLRYDRGARVYEKGEDFASCFRSSEAARYLGELLALEQGVLGPGEVLAGWHPPVGSIGLPNRAVADSTLVALIQAMRDQKAVEISYQSLSRAEPVARAISPHAFAHDGFRWHVRAFCHKRERFLDFVLGRIIWCGNIHTARSRQEQDAEWNNILTLIIAPHPLLEEGRRRAIELDYGMKDGHVAFKCRQALLFYTLKQLGLDRDAVGVDRGQHIILKNNDEIARYLETVP